MFGVLGEDGSGTNHEFEDGRAERKATVTTGNTTYTFSEWNIWNDTGAAGTTNDPRDAPDDFDPGEWIGAASGPTITLAPETLTDFSYTVGDGPSSEKTFTAEGSDLTADISITPPTNYEISTGTGGSFSATNPITLTQSGGSVSTTTIYVRLKTGLAVGDYNSEDITATSTGATNKTVTCSGSVNAPANPGSFSATAASTSQIDLAFTTNAAPNDVVIVYDADGSFTAPSGAAPAVGNSFAGGTVLYKGTTSPVNHTGLSASQTVYYKAWSVDGSNNYSSGLTDNATTQMGPITSFPWSEGFENGGVIPDGWSNDCISGTVDWTYADGGNSGNPASAHGGSYNALFYSGNYDSDKTKLVSPRLDLSGVDTPKLNFWHTQAEYDGDQDELRVYYRTSSSGSWTLITGQEYTGNITTWTKETDITLPNKSNDYYIAFEGLSGYGYGVCIDDVSIAGIKAEPTNHVTNFTTTADGSSKINLSWTANDGAVVPDGYLIKASTSDNVSAPSDGTAIADNTTIGNNSGAMNIAHGTNEYEWSGLDAETEYFFKIYPYTNSGSDIDYKTDETVPSGDATTTEAPSIVAPTAGVVYISEICDAGDYECEFMELYNNSSNIINLSNSKLIRLNTTATSTEYVFDFDTDGSGDIQIPANGIIIIARGTTKTDFELEWGSLPNGVNFNEGNNNLYFGSSRQWAIKDGGTANTNDGTAIDATNRAMSDGNGDYQYPTSTWSYEAEANATPGTISATQDPAAYLWDGGASTTNWGDANNWNPNQTPTVNTNVTIDDTKTALIIDTDETANCYNLTVDGSLTIKSDATSTGSLIINGTVAGSGTTMERNISAYTAAGNGWHLLSSPVNNMLIAGSDFEPGTATPNLDDFYGWDEVNNQWLNQKVGANSITNFVNGTGYLVSYETGATKDFTGTFNNADVTFTNLSRTTDDGGMHLVGNPFQSALQWTNTDWVRTNIGIAAKIMNNGGTYQDITVGGTDIIPANQGFFIEAETDANNTFTMPKSQRVHNTQAFYKSEILNFLTLKAIDGNYYQESWVQFMDGSTEAYDAEFDVRFMSGMAEAPQMYSICGDELLSTNRISTPEDETTIPFGFSTQTESTITIEASGVSSFNDEYKIVLEDLLENNLVDLQENPSYTFESKPEFASDRFLLHFKSTNGIEESEINNDFEIYSFSSNLYILNPNRLDATVVVYNALGQEVKKMQINGDEKSNFYLNIEAGYYVVKVINSESISTKKVHLQ